MVPTLLLGAALCAAAPAATDLDVYEALRSQVGREPEGQIKLALWCEAHGFPAEAAKHLALAVLSDPKNARARGLMGLVDFGGRWRRPEAVTAIVAADEALLAKRAEYNARRSRAAGTADSHWKLALWCEEVGLDAEAQAHLSSTVRLDPGREAAWKRLGFKKLNGRWVTDAQLAAEKAEAEARKKADQYWRPLLAKWRGWLGEKARRSEAEDALAKVEDPRAVPAVCAVFAAGDATQQAMAVQLLGQIDAPEASRALAMLAVFGRSAQPRRLAVETLRRRDLRDFMDLIIGLLRNPIKYEVRPVGGPGTPGELFVEGERYNVQRLYGVNPNLARRIPARMFDASVAFNPFSAQNIAMATSKPGEAVLQSAQAYSASWLDPRMVDASAMAARRDLQVAQALERIRPLVAVSQQQLDDDVAALEARNVEISAVNDRTRSVLTTVTLQDPGDTPEAWRAWWTDQKGYAVKTPEPAPLKPTITTFVENPASPLRTHNSCFGAGTPVRTLEGPRPIESIRVGDQVLSQDIATGRLRFVPVLAIYHNEPAPTFRVELGDETIIATGIHRFWKAAKGWVMARDLKPQDALRTLGGTIPVGRVTRHSVLPVYNLEVAEGQSFFVGKLGALVHDNSLVQSTNEPFDAPAEPAALARNRR